MKQTDFGDILTSMIDHKKAAEAEERRRNEEARVAAHAVWQEAMRPLLTVMRQVKERYPRSSIHGMVSEWSRDPHFYVDGNTRIHVGYELDTKVFTLVQNQSGYRTFNNQYLVQSENPEDLIPTLLEKLVICVERK